MHIHYDPILILSTLFVNLYKIAYIYVHMFQAQEEVSEMPTAQNSLYLCKLYILDASLAYPSPGPDMFTCIEKSLWE